MLPVGGGGFFAVLISQRKKLICSLELRLYLRADRSKGFYDLPGSDRPHVASGRNPL